MQLFTRGSVAARFSSAISVLQRRQHLDRVTCVYHVPRSLCAAGVQVQEQCSTCLTGCDLTGSLSLCPADTALFSNSRATVALHWRR